MATFTAVGAGNWTSNATWGTAAGAVEGVNYPGPNDTADLAGFVVTMDIDTIPSTGALASLTSAGTAGQLAIAMGSRGNTVAINTGTLIGGLKPATSGTIYISGVGTGKTVTITASTSIVGGTNASAAAIYNTSSNLALVVKTPIATGGSAASANAIQNQSASGTTTLSNTPSGVMDLVGGSNGAIGYYQGAADLTCSITAAVKTGTTINSCGVNLAAGTNCTFSGTIVNQNGFMAWQGGYPGTWSPAATDYIKMGTQYFPPPVAAGNLKDGVWNGVVEGTMVAGYTVNGIACS